jgi:glutathione S-transferase
MLEVATEGVEKGPWLLGDRFTAADVLVGSGLRFGLKFGILPKDGAIAKYVERLTVRAAYLRADAIEQREGERFSPARS